MSCCKIVVVREIEVHRIRSKRHVGIVVVLDLVSVCLFHSNIHGHGKVILHYDFCREPYEWLLLVAIINPFYIFFILVVAFKVHFKFAFHPEEVISKGDGWFIGNVFLDPVKTPNGILGKAFIVNLIEVPVNFGKSHRTVENKVGPAAVHYHAGKIIKNPVSCRDYFLLASSKD